MNYNVILFVDSSMLGGIETHLIELSKLLKKNNVQSSILFYKNHFNTNFYSILDEQRIHYEFLQGNMKSLIGKFARYSKNTVVHTHGYKAGILGRLACKLTNKRCVSTYHAGEAGEGIVRLYNKCDQWLSPLSINFAVSNKIKNTLKNAHLLENFIDLKTPNSLKKHDINKPINIGFVGRLSYEKGPDIFFQLAKNMQDNNAIRFHLFGDGPLKNTIPKLNNLTYHGLTHRDAIWNKIDVLLICSREEGLPMTLLEAMSERKLVISTAVGAIPSIIKNNQTGLLNTKADADSCQRNLTYLLNSTDEQINTMLDSAYSMLETRFSGKKQFSLLEQAYTGKL